MNIWQPIEVAPRHCAERLYLARFEGEELVELDFDGIWSESEGIWLSHNGIDAPTHWAKQSSLPPPTHREDEDSLVIWAACGKHKLSRVVRNLDDCRYKGSVVACEFASAGKVFAEAIDPDWIWDARKKGI